jgi:hypothetical protein
MGKSSGTRDVNYSMTFVWDGNENHGLPGAFERRHWMMIVFRVFKSHRIITNTVTGGNNVN